MAKPIHILLADDDPMMRRLIGGQLAKKGFEILYAHDGNEAREMARRLQPDIVLLDYRMPILDGLKVAEYLKKEQPTKHLPILLLTSADISIEGQKAWKELGVDDYVHKGEDFEIIFERIQKLLKAYGRETADPKK